MPTQSRQTAVERERVAQVLALLQTHYGAATCALDYNTPLQLLVATMLSAQCTDKRVNLTTPALFAAYPDVRALAAADVARVEELVHSTGFYRNKAKHLVAMAQQLLQRHDGAVPRTLDELVALPGVARKTANVILSVAFGRAEGIVVDTHVLRLSARLGLSRQADALWVERDLMAIVPKWRWLTLSLQLIDHGRAICTARKPACAACPLAGPCPAAAAQG